MKVNGAQIINATAAGTPTLTPQIIARYSKRSVRSVYVGIKDSPPPLWLMAAITAWFDEKGPIAPPPVNAAFAWYMARAETQAYPKPAFAMRRGRPKRFDSDDDDDDGPDNGGKKACKTNGKEPGQKDSGNTTKEQKDTKPVAAKLLQQENNTETPSSGSNATPISPNGGHSSAASNARDPSLSGSISGSPEEATSDPTSGTPSKTTSNQSTPPLTVEPLTPTATRKSPDSLSLAANQKATAQPGGKGVVEGGCHRSLWKPNGNQNPAANARRFKAEHNWNDSAAIFASVNNWDDAEAYYVKLARLPIEPRDQLNALKAHIQAQPWGCDEDTGEPLTGNAIRACLFRATGVAFRRRKLNLQVQRRNQALIEIVSPRVSQHRRDAHNKGAGQYSLGSLRAIIAGVLREPEIQKLLNNHDDIRGAHLPCAAKIEALLREHRGGSNREMECRDHLERTIGFRAAYAGQVAMVDSTGWPVRFTTGTESKKHKEQIFLCCDIASGFLRVANFSATSESEGWRPKENPERRDVMLMFLREMDFFPEWLVNDAISTLTDGLRDLQPGRHPAERLSSGVLLWLAGGVQPYVRMAGRPTGGAQVERGVRTTKDKLAELGTQRAVMLEAKGLGLRKIYDCEHRLEFLNIITQGVGEVNNSQLRRRGCPFTRIELHEKEAAQQKRDARKCAGNLWAGEEHAPLWQRIVAGAKTGEVIGGRVAIRIGGKPWKAELTVPDGGWRCKPEGRTALILPPGARADDDPEEFRVIVIEADKHGVAYHCSSARSIEIDEYWQEMVQPEIGAFRALPETHADELGRVRDKEAAAYRKSLRTGTTNEPITPGLNSN